VRVITIRNIRQARTTVLVQYAMVNGEQTCSIRA